jgi:hypothetical protein
MNDRSRKIIDPGRKIIDPARKIIDPAEKIVDPARKIIDPAEKIVDPARKIIDPARKIIDPARKKSGLWGSSFIPAWAWRALPPGATASGSVFVWRCYSVTWSNGCSARAEE